MRISAFTSEQLQSIRALSIAGSAHTHNKFSDALTGAAAAHRWYYAKDMHADEAYVFTCYDSRSDRARFTPHTGFTDPTTPADAPQRESIEIRAYAFWGNEPQQPIALDL